MTALEKAIDDASPGLKRIMEHHDETRFKSWLAGGTSGVRIDKEGSWIFITQRQIEIADECIKNSQPIPARAFEPFKFVRRPTGKTRPRRR